jgi:cytochrome c5
MLRLSPPHKRSFVAVERASMHLRNLAPALPRISTGLIRVSLCAGLLLCVAGCARPQSVDRATLLARAVTLTPAEARLADLYQHACRACHVVATSGAPLTGDRAAWQVRLNKGMPVLVGNAIAGLNGMPAGGQCVRCTAGDYELLIRFMAGEGQ